MFLDKIQKPLSTCCRFSHAIGGNLVNGLSRAPSLELLYPEPSDGEVPISAKPEPITIDLTLSPSIPIVSPTVKLESVISLISDDDNYMMLDPQPMVVSSTVRLAPVVADTVLVQGTVFKGWEDARKTVFAAEEKLGHIWKTDQSKRDTAGELKKVTLRCHRAGLHIPYHSTVIDPSDRRHGKSIKTSCPAHINVNQIHPGMWHFAKVNQIHNHD